MVVIKILWTEPDQISKINIFYKLLDTNYYKIQ